MIELKPWKYWRSTLQDFLPPRTRSLIVLLWELLWNSWTSQNWNRIYCSRCGRIRKFGYGWCRSCRAPDPTRAGALEVLGDKAFKALGA